MKTKSTASALSTFAALGLLLGSPLLAQSPTPRASKMDPSNIGNISSTGQSLRYRRPRKRRIVNESPTNIRNSSRRPQSLKYRGPKNRRSSSQRRRSRTSRTSRR